MKRSIAVLLLLACSLPTLAAKVPYTYYRVGSPSDVSTPTSAGTVLMGGGEDVAAAFQWLCARSGGGDFLVIRVTGTDAYNPWVQDLCPGVNSVATLIIPTSDAANDPAVKAYIDAAEILWIAGGDQSNYINYWQGTPVQAAVNASIQRGVPVGGTSAGMNVLTQFVYSALASKGVTSSQALADPFNRYMSFARDFLNVPGLQATIADPHFVTRDRMGREIAFLCRQYAYGWAASPRAIAVDEATALLVEPNGGVSVVGTGTAYFLSAAAPPAVCQPKTPLTYENVDVYRIGPQSGSFDLVKWSGRGGTGYKVSATAGVITSTQADGSPY